MRNKLVFDANQEANDLPFGPPKRNSRPILSTEVAKELRAMGAEIWRIEKQAYGLLFRCLLNKKQIRVVLPVSKKIKPAFEVTSAIHTVRTLESLRSWLRSLS